MSEETFKPNDKARATFRRMCDSAAEVMMNQFFEIWEAEGDPHKAGSMAAHAYIRNAARMAVFGACCAGEEPQPDLWRAACEAALTAALRDVDAAFAETATAEALVADQREVK